MKGILYILVGILLLNVFKVSGEDHVKVLYDNSIRTLNSDPDSSFYYAEQLLSYSTKEKSVYGQVNANFILGWLVDKKRNNPGRAMIYYFEGIRASKNSEDPEILKLRVYLMGNMGTIFTEFNDPERAIKYYQDAFDLAFRIGFTIEQIKNLTWIGKVYHNMKEYDNAIEFYNQANEINLSYGNKKWELSIRNSKGWTLLEAGRYEEALHAYETNLKQVERYGDDFYIYKFYAINNIGEVYHFKGEYDMAIQKYKEVIQLKEEKKGFKEKNQESYFNSIYELAGVYRDKGDTDMAIEAYQRAEEFSETLYNQTQTKFFEPLINLANLYEEKEEYVLANFYRKKYSEKLDAHLARMREIEQVDKKYNLELILARYNTLVAQQERNEKIEYYGAVTAIGFIILIVLILLYNAYQRYRLRRELERSINAIEEKSHQTV